MKSGLFLLLVAAMLTGCHHPNDPVTEPSIMDSVYGERTACLLSQLAYHKSSPKTISQYLPVKSMVGDHSLLTGIGIDVGLHISSG